MKALPSWVRIYDEAAHPIVGCEPKLDLLFENTKYPFAHEAGVYIPQDNSLWITSNQYSHMESCKKRIHISRVRLPSNENTCTNCEELEVKNVPLPNGGVNYKDGILFCAQGTHDVSGGITYMPLNQGDGKGTLEAKMLVSDFHGRPFNSPNDVVVHSDGSIWFTDPIYGWEQGIRPRPRLPSQVYRFDPATKGIRAIADGFGRPNGICFSPDEKTVYITDTDGIHGDGGTDETRASHM
ncbi:hypothetical protein ACEQ8H_007789 [Pleosporales sp. CAS-2024a]